MQLILLIEIENIKANIITINCILAKGYALENVLCGISIYVHKLQVALGYMMLIWLLVPGLESNILKYITFVIKDIF